MLQEKTVCVREVVPCGPSALHPVLVPVLDPALHSVLDPALHPVLYLAFLKMRHLKVTIRKIFQNKNNIEQNQPSSTHVNAWARNSFS
jgi:hypothetical protein